MIRTVNLRMREWENKGSNLFLYKGKREKREVPRGVQVWVAAVKCAGGRSVFFRTRKFEEQKIPHSQKHDHPWLRNTCCEMRIIIDLDGINRTEPFLLCSVLRLFAIVANEKNVIILFFVFSRNQHYCSGPKKNFPCDSTTITV